MQAKKTAVDLVFGIVLVVAGLTPGFFQRIGDGVRDSRDLLFGLPATWRRTDYEKFERPIWLALLGVVFLLLGILGTMPD